MMVDDIHEEGGLIFADESPQPTCFGQMCVYRYKRKKHLLYHHCIHGPEKVKQKKKYNTAQYIFQSYTTRNELK